MFTFDEWMNKGYIILKGSKATRGEDGICRFSESQVMKKEDFIKAKLTEKKDRVKKFRELADKRYHAHWDLIKLAKKCENGISKGDALHLLEHDKSILLKHHENYLLDDIYDFDDEYGYFD